MPIHSQNQIEEINAIIQKIEGEMKPADEIGAQKRTILASTLAAQKIKRKPKYFSCKPEYSETIVNYFVTEKGLTKSRFHMNSRDSIFLLPTK